MKTSRTGSRTAVGEKAGRDVGGKTTGGRDDNGTPPPFSIRPVPPPHRTRPTGRTFVVRFFVSSVDAFPHDPSLVASPHVGAVTNMEVDNGCEVRFLLAGGG
uniref:Uncharacterized protein n=1 Tax=Odontella aurita TaxID=265563 RepID=A0A7S4IY42_9STRA|mmetsp:Transcript_3253/g.8408  ORF Transcript_3253/g.8408 Transcript_3253/m.8408 type:complete len:102 (+) Transcript_3253:31-336(+)